MSRHVFLVRITEKNGMIFATPSSIIIYNLRRDRFEQLTKALRKKHDTAFSINEKIEITERLASIGMTIDSEDFSITLDEAKNLKRLPNLTYAQKLRLNWLPDIDPENESQTVADLLPQSDSYFEMAKLALLSVPIAAEIYTRIDNITGKYEVAA